MSWWAPTQKEVQAEAGAWTRQAVADFQRRTEQREQRTAEAVAAAVSRQERTREQIAELQERITRITERLRATEQEDR